KAGRDEPAKQSARNRFPGIVTRVIKDRVAAQVEIQAGPHRLVSLLTREAVDDLDLKPGMPAIAVVKVTNVSVALPRGSSARRHHLTSFLCGVYWSAATFRPGRLPSK